MDLFDEIIREQEYELYTQQDIEELEASYDEEQEYFEVMNAYQVVTANISYYPEDLLQNLLDLINQRIQKDT